MTKLLLKALIWIPVTALAVMILQALFMGSP